MLPEFLFHHFLICKSSPCVINLDILDSLHYLNRLKRKNESIQPIEESNDEICISIDDYLLDFRSNFFYKECPAVVCSSDFDSKKERLSFRGFYMSYVLILVIKEDTKVERRECMKILPSEFWSMRTEMEVWHEFPVSYSYVVNTVCQCLGFAKECEILKWIIIEFASLWYCYRFAYEGSHLYVIETLYRKAIEREANRKNWIQVSTFDCPVLLEVMMWLSSQFTVLYGEVNGKLFSKELLKWCLLNAASSSLLCPLNEKGGTVYGKDLEFVGSIASGNVKLEVPDENFNAEVSVYESSVFVSQVTAAVAALHEDRCLREKIKGLRRAGSLPRSQLLKEHLYVSTRAIEERGKRPNYRPILEHDGLLWQRYQNKDSNKSKTREELLAEEQRLQTPKNVYRGKKVKRSKTEVRESFTIEAPINYNLIVKSSLRDIIEVHMNENQTSRWHWVLLSKDLQRPRCFHLVPISVHDMPVVDMLTSNRDSSEPSNRPEYGIEKQSYPHHSVSARAEFVTPRSHKQEQEKYQKNKQDKEYRCRSPENYRSRRSYERHRHPDDQEESGISARKRVSDAKHSHTRQGYESHGHHESEDHKRSTRKNKQDKEYRSRKSREGRSSKYDKGSSVSSHRSRYHDSRSTSSNDKISDVMVTTRGETSERYRSESVRENVIEDRYDPSGSNIRYQDANDDPLHTASMPGLTNHTILSDSRHCDADLTSLQKDLLCIIKGILEASFVVVSFLILILYFIMWLYSVGYVITTYLSYFSELRIFS
ncbi:hypothetical protein MKW92_019096 [Papaver armeniacum]|nr:hypothetical protein MKW92_019096 [Papaver armeniacum]